MRGGVIATKKLINIVVVITTCIAVLWCTTFSAFAEGMSCVDEVTADDPNIPYDLYMEQLRMQVPMNMALDGEAALFAWDAAAASAGVFMAPGPWTIGLLLAGGGILWVDGFVETTQEIIKTGPQAWSDFCTLVEMALDSDFVHQVEDITKAILNGDSFIVSQELKQNLADAVNGVAGVTTDSEGNIVDTSLVVPESELRVGTTWNETFTASSSNRKWISASVVDSNGSEYVLSGSNEYLVWDFYQSKSAENKDSKHIISNKKTGAVLTIGTDFASGTQNNSMSRWYHCTDEDGDGAQFWMFGHAYGSNGSQRTVCVKQGMKWFEFSNTGTVLDGKRFVDGVWNAATNTWKYLEEGTGLVTSFVMDPLGTILSNTGVDAIPGAGSATAGVCMPNPACDPSAPILAPPVVQTPTAVGSATVTLTNVTSNSLSQAKADTGSPGGDPIEPPPLDTPDGIKDFLKGFADFFAGIFDWLPKPVADTLDGVLVTLSGIVVLMAVAKVVDILWP